MKVKRVDAYKCPQCEQLWEDEMEARECCPLDQEEAYKCGNCDELHEDREDAKECCK